MLNKSRPGLTRGSFPFPHLQTRDGVVDASCRAAGWHALVRAVGLARGYLTAGLLGIALSPAVGSISVFWPANALLVGALLRTDPRDCPLILAACATASATAHLLQGDAVGLAGALAAANMLNVWCGYCLIARLAGPNFRVADLRVLFPLLAASLIAPASRATAAALIVRSFLGLSASSLWWTWWQDRPPSA